VMGVALGSMWARREDLMRLAGCSTESSPNVSVDLIVSTITRCAAVLTAIGIADYAYQWWQYEKGLRMSRQDILDELKQTEGDPRMRSRRKALRRNMLQQGITSQAKRASVVVTNPTHLAVALLYRPGMYAPRVVAKGRHVIAERIVALAARNNVPVVQNLDVARALYKASGIGDYIPGALFQAVAEILAVLVRRAEERRRRFASYHRAPARQPAQPSARIP
jgi:flagellar biosynthetic protein FlhB